MRLTGLIFDSWLYLHNYSLSRQKLFFGGSATTGTSTSSTVMPVGWILDWQIEKQWLSTYHGGLTI